MEHKALDDIGQVAQVFPSLGAFAPRSRRERLERWALLLDRLGDRPIRPLVRLEFMPENERARARADESPLTVAYGDPALREAGLKGDSYGEARAFFELTESEAHYVLCDCHYHGSMPASLAGARVRSVAGLDATARRPTTLGQLWSRITGCAR